jgi:hypothetical protein
MKGKTAADIQRRIRPFTNAGLTASHGRPILAAQARECGLIIKDIEIESDLWKKVLEFHMRADRAVSTDCGKLIESPEHNFLVQIRGTRS